MNVYREKICITKVSNFYIYIYLQLNDRCQLLWLKQKKILMNHQFTKVYTVHRVS